MLREHPDPELAPLAWIASLASDHDRVPVRHGELVESREGWLAEAVWAADFESGDFDRTPLVFGSGIRIREDGVHFVSAGTTVDRLWVWTADDEARRLISNSLVPLLSHAGACPDKGYRGYRRDLESIVDGLRAYRRSLPVTRGRLEVVYFNNLFWDGTELSVVPKPRLDSSFSSFDDYRSFLSDAALALSTNARSPARQHRIRLLTSISSGYDSPAVSVVAREMGCNRAVTINRARSLFPRSDSGAEIGRMLGLDVGVYDRDQAIGRSELHYWAAMGKPQDVNLGIFDYPGPVCLFLTGFHGDKVWTSMDHDTSDQIVRGDSTGLGFTEDRLARGVLHCPVPYWGVRHMDEIARITRSQEMNPWRLHTDYDRPIPRRIVEEQGVPREAFGQRKSATSSNWRPFPYTPDLRRDFASYVKEQTGTSIPTSLKRVQSSLERCITAIEEKWPKASNYLPRLTSDVPDLHFHWATDRLACTLADQLGTQSTPLPPSAE